VKANRSAVRGADDVGVTTGGLYDREQVGDVIGECLVICTLAAGRVAATRVDPNLESVSQKRRHAIPRVQPSR